MSTCNTCAERRQKSDCASTRDRVIMTMITTSLHQPSEPDLSPAHTPVMFASSLVSGTALWVSYYSWACRVLCCGDHVLFLPCRCHASRRFLRVTRKKLQTPGNAEEHKRHLSSLSPCNTCDSMTYLTCTKHQACTKLVPGVYQACTKRTCMYMSGALGPTPIWVRRTSPFWYS